MWRNNNTHQPNWRQQNPFSNQANRHPSHHDAPHSRSTHGQRPPPLLTNPGQTFSTNPITTHPGPRFEYAPNTRTSNLSHQQTPNPSKRPSSPPTPPPSKRSHTPTTYKQQHTPGSKHNEYQRQQTIILDSLTINASNINIIRSNFTTKSTQTNISDQTHEIFFETRNIPKPKTNPTPPKKPNNTPTINPNESDVSNCVQPPPEYRDPPTPNPPSNDLPAIIIPTDMDKQPAIETDKNESLYEQSNDPSDQPPNSTSNPIPSTNPHTTPHVTPIPDTEHSHEQPTNDTDQQIPHTTNTYKTLTDSDIATILKDIETEDRNTEQDRNDSYSNDLYNNTHTEQDEQYAEFVNYIIDKNDHEYNSYMRDGDPDTEHVEYNTNDRSADRDLHLASTLLEQADNINRSEDTNTDQQPNPHSEKEPGVLQPQNLNHPPTTRRLDEHISISDSEEEFDNHNMLDNLLEGLTQEIKNSFTNYLKELVILDNIKIDNHFKTILSLGPKFIFPTPINKNNDITGLLISATQLLSFHNFDNIIQSQECSKKFDEIFNDLIPTYCHKSWLKTLNARQLYLHKGHQATIKYLKTRPDIHISEADKGKKVVICLQSTFNDKMNSLLEAGVRKGTYNAIIDPSKLTTQRLAAKILQITNKATTDYNKLRELINFFIQGGYIVPTQYLLDMHYRIKPSKCQHTYIRDNYIYTPGHRRLNLVLPKQGTLPTDNYVMARMRISIKTHKTDYPVRPIIAAPNPIGKTMEDYIHKLLKLFITPTFHNQSQLPVESIVHVIQSKTFIIKNYQQVLDGIKNLSIPINHQLYTLDHVDMYTNVDLNQAIQIITRDFDMTIGERTLIPLELFIDAIKYLMHYNGFFIAQNNIYKQNKGLTMGGGLSYILSEIVTSDGLAKAVIDSISKGLQVTAIFKYVDDILIIMNGQDTDNSGTRWINSLSNTITQHLNGMGTTHEVETPFLGYPSITYLNMRIIRTPNPSNKNKQNIQTIWYRPKYKSNRTIHGLSQQPQHLKDNTISELIKSALKTTSLPLQTYTIPTLYMICRDNCHPLHTFKRLTIKACESLKIPTEHIISSIDSPELNITTPISLKPSHNLPIPNNKNPNTRKRGKCMKCLTKFRLPPTISHICKNQPTAIPSIANPDPNVPTQLHHVSTHKLFFPKVGERFNVLPQKDNGITHLIAPNVTNLSKQINKASFQSGIRTKLVHPSPRNPLFKTGKQPLSIPEKTLVSFIIPCNICPQPIFYTAIHHTISNICPKLNIAHRQANNHNHSLNPDKIHILRTYSTKNKAHTGDKILSNIIKMIKLDKVDSLHKALLQSNEFRILAQYYMPNVLGLTPPS